MPPCCYRATARWPRGWARCPSSCRPAPYPAPIDRSGEPKAVWVGQATVSFQTSPGERNRVNITKHVANLNRSRNPRTQTSQPTWRVGTQLVQSTARSTRAGTVAADGITEFEAQLPSTRHAIRSTHTDRTVVSRPQIPSLRTSLRGQPHTQGRANRGSATAQHLGGIRHMARRHGLRSEWHRAMVDTVSVETASLLDHASAARGTGATMVECALAYAPRPTPTSLHGAARSTGRTFMKTWGNLRL